MKDEDDDDEAIGVSRYPCMPSLVALQQMRNRLQLAQLGRKLMRWTALATGKEMRRLAMELDEASKSFHDDCKNAYIMLARCRYCFPRMNHFVLESVPHHPLTANVKVTTTVRTVTAVKCIVYTVVKLDRDPYEMFMVGRGGEECLEARQTWFDLLLSIINWLQVRACYEAAEAAHLAATKKLILGTTYLSRLISRIERPLYNIEAFLSDTSGKLMKLNRKITMQSESRETRNRLLKRDPGADNDCKIDSTFKEYASTAENRDKFYSHVDSNEAGKLPSPSADCEIHTCVKKPSFGFLIKADNSFEVNMSGLYAEEHVDVEMNSVSNTDENILLRQIILSSGKPIHTKVQLNDVKISINSDRGSESKIILLQNDDEETDEFAHSISERQEILFPGNLYRTKPRLPTQLVYFENHYKKIVRKSSIQHHRTGSFTENKHFCKRVRSQSFHTMNNDTLSFLSQNSSCDDDCSTFTKTSSAPVNASPHMACPRLKSCVSERLQSRKNNSKEYEAVPTTSHVNESCQPSESRICCRRIPSPQTKLGPNVCPAARKFLEREIEQERRTLEEAKKRILEEKQKLEEEKTKIEEQRKKIGLTFCSLNADGSLENKMAGIEKQKWRIKEEMRRLEEEKKNMEEQRKRIRSPSFSVNRNTSLDNNTSILEAIKKSIEDENKIIEKEKQEFIEQRKIIRSTTHNSLGSKISNLACNKNTCIKLKSSDIKIEQETSVNSEILIQDLGTNTKPSITCCSIPDDNLSNLSDSLINKIGQIIVPNQKKFTFQRRFGNVCCILDEKNQLHVIRKIEANKATAKGKPISANDNIIAIYKIITPKIELTVEKENEPASVSENTSITLDPLRIPQINASLGVHCDNSTCQFTSCPMTEQLEKKPKTADDDTSMGSTQQKNYTKSNLKQSLSVEKSEKLIIVSEITSATSDLMKRFKAEINNTKEISDSSRMPVPVEKSPNANAVSENTGAQSKTDYEAMPGKNIGQLKNKDSDANISSLDKSTSTTSLNRILGHYYPRSESISEILHCLRITSKDTIGTKTIKTKKTECLSTRTSTHCSEIFKRDTTVKLKPSCREITYKIAESKTSEIKVPNNSVNEINESCLRKCGPSRQASRTAQGGKKKTPKKIIGTYCSNLDSKLSISIKPVEVPRPVKKENGTSVTDVARVRITLKSESENTPVVQVHSSACCTDLTYILKRNKDGLRSFRKACLRENSEINAVTCVSKASIERSEEEEIIVMADISVDATKPPAEEPKAKLFGRTRSSPHSCLQTIVTPLKKINISTYVDNSVEAVNADTSVSNLRPAKPIKSTCTPMTQSKSSMSTMSETSEISQRSSCCIVKIIPKKQKQKPENKDAKLILDLIESLKSIVAAQNEKKEKEREKKVKKLSTADKEKDVEIKIYKPSKDRRKPFKSASDSNSCCSCQHMTDESDESLACCVKIKTMSNTTSDDCIAIETKRSSCTNTPKQTKSLSNKSDAWTTTHRRGRYYLLSKSKSSGSKHNEGYDTKSPNSYMCNDEICDWSEKKRKDKPQSRSKSPSNRRANNNNVSKKCVCRSRTTIKQTKSHQQRHIKKEK